MSLLETRLTRLLGIKTPLICGAMYPCSNLELVTAVSEAGGLGIIQPLSLVYVYKKNFKEALKEMRARTSKPLGMNVIVEKSSRIYEQRMQAWVGEALEAGIRFFVTALGNPTWVLKAVHAAGGLVYHDITERSWAEKALDYGVDGLICVNSSAGGHSGTRSSEELHAQLKGLGVPLICAGGVGDEKDFVHALQLGYDGVQMGTRFIATTECASHSSYKQAIVNATAEDIVRTTRVTGVPLSVIRTPYLERVGTDVGPILRRLLQWPRTKHWARTALSIQSVWKLKKSSLKGLSTKDYWQAGKSADHIHAIEPAAAIVERFHRAAEQTR